MNQNPYQSPSVASSMSMDGGVSPQTINLLVRTQPWVRLISIVGLVIAGLMFVALILGATGVGALSLKHGGTAAPVAMFLPALLVMVLYIYPMLKLAAYAAGIRRLKFSGSVNDLNYALDQQRAFWKFVGVLMLIAVILWVLAFLAGLGGALMMSREVGP